MWSLEVADEVLPRSESWRGTPQCGRGVGGEAGRGVTSFVVTTLSVKMNATLDANRSHVRRALDGTPKGVDLTCRIHSWSRGHKGS